MYLWKCWRDSRASFFVFLSLFLFNAAWTAVAPTLHHSNEEGWSVQMPKTPAEVERAWQLAMRGIAPAGLMMGILAGVGMGATGVGAEFRSGTLEFLLTRPRRRRFFLWTAWAFGIAEALAFVLVYVLVGMAAIGLVTGRVSLRLLVVLPILLTAAAVGYGLSYFLTVLGRDAKYGTGPALVLIVGYSVFVAAVRHYWQVHLPTLWDMMPDNGSDILAWLAHPTPFTTLPFPTTAMLGWLAVAVAFPVAAHLLFDRQEV